MPLPVVQFRRRDDLIDLGWGHPSPGVLPVDAWADACASAIRTSGADALTYGYAAGPGPLIEHICQRLAGVDAQPPSPSEVFVTAGASHALELVCGALLRPADTVLVDSPTYHLARRVLADHTSHVIAAPSDEVGIDPDTTMRLLMDLRQEGRAARMLYLVPTFANPTGRSLPAQRRRALVEVAARTATLIVEDDTYRELAYDGPPPASLWSLADAGTVVRIGSYSKTVAPGIRLGYLTGDPELIARLVSRGYVDSGGGVNHATALAMAHFAASGAYNRHVTDVRSFYRRQRDHLVSALRSQLANVEFVVPDGGWYVWLRLPPGMDSDKLLPTAEAHGVSYLAGSRFFVGTAGHNHLRLSFSMLPPEELHEGIRRLATAMSRHRR